MDDPILLLKSALIKQMAESSQRREKALNSLSKDKLQHDRMDARYVLGFVPVPSFLRSNYVHFTAVHAVHVKVLWILEIPQ